MTKEKKEIRNVLLDSTIVKKIFFTGIISRS